MFGFREPFRHVEGVSDCVRELEHLFLFCFTRDTGKEEQIFGEGDKLLHLGEEILDRRAVLLH